MNVRPGVPYVNPPAPHFAGHAYSELIASGLQHTIEGKKVRVIVPKTIDVEQRQKITENLKQIGFDGLTAFYTEYQTDGNLMIITAIVE